MLPCSLGSSQDRTINPEMRGWGKGYGFIPKVYWPGRWQANFQNNCLVGVWMPGSLTEQREGVRTKVKRQKEWRERQWTLQTFIRIARLWKRCVQLFFSQVGNVLWGSRYVYYNNNSSKKSKRYSNTESRLVHLSATPLPSLGFAHVVLCLII